MMTPKEKAEAKPYDGEFKIRGDSSVRSQRYYCPVHGDVTEKLMIISVDGKVIGRYCILCFNDLLDKQIGQVRELPGATR